MHLTYFNKSSTFSIDVAHSFKDISENAKNFEFIHPLIDQISENSIGKKFNKHKDSIFNPLKHLKNPDARVNQRRNDFQRITFPFVIASILHILNRDGLFQFTRVAFEDLTKASLSEYFSKVIVKPITDFGHVFLHV